jgi:calcineurin-binding protein cabin-1
MFSIAAINDTDSKAQWEPLAPTKEAQEVHLTQTYHDGLRKLQAKEYEKACELLESVLKDPLLSGAAQADSSASDGHLLQLRFLALKNLASVFLQQGSTHYENALRCYLQAVEIDSKDSVVWNQLGTLSCSMGLLSISRWAFEQGLFCSPNNWNCMEKLLEVLIAIGDEVACLSVANLILRHWPSHTRALHVKITIEESEPIPFAPRGIDKLEPKHIHLKFVNKRKSTDTDIGEDVSSKKLNQNVELNLLDASWTNLAGSLIELLCPGNSEGNRGDIRVIIHLPLNLKNTSRGFVEKGICYTENCHATSEKSNAGEKEASICKEQPQERRSSRLEILRSRNPSKEELDFSTNKDVGKVVIQFLEPFIAIRSFETKSCDTDSSSDKAVATSLDDEVNDVVRFVNETSRNFGSFHLGHLLLEEVAKRRILYNDDYTKLLELEKLTRQWGLDRSPECTLFLAELYFDIGSRSSDSSELMFESSYHLCKLIESVALDYPFRLNSKFGEENSEVRSFFSDKRAFLIRFYWLSGKLSVLDGDKAKAKKEFGISLSLFTEKENSTIDTVCLPHCKGTSKLTVDSLFHEIKLLEIDNLLKKKGQMVEKDVYYDECLGLLAPLLFSKKDVDLGISCLTSKEGEKGNFSVELSALDVLLEACGKAKPMDMGLYLNCHKRKLQMLMLAAGMEENPISQKDVCKIEISKLHPDGESKEEKYYEWNHMISEEVKEITRCASEMKSLITPENSSGVTVQMGIIGDIQSLMVTLMYNIVSMYFSRKSCVSGQNRQQQEESCFLDAAITFFKLQHWNPNVPVKTQIDLIVAIHDMLAEFGLCCASGDGEEEDGTFLKLAIKHLLALDMKLKSNTNKVVEFDDQLLRSDHIKISSRKFDSTNETSTMEEDTVEWMASNGISSHKDHQKKNLEVGHCEQAVVDCDSSTRENRFTEFGRELNEDEREELELAIDNALDQCFFCLYGLSLRSDSSYEDDLASHKNTSRGDYQTKEQCADVFQYILPYAKASSKTGLVKLRKVLRAIRKHFPEPPEEVLCGNAIDKFLDDPHLCEDKLSEEAGSDGFLDSIMKVIYPDFKSLKPITPAVSSSDPYLDVYRNLYYLLAQSDETSATDKWPGFVLTKEGEDFVQQNVKLFKYDLLYNPLRLESWRRLADIYDEEVDLMLNDGSKQINVSAWRKSSTLPHRVDISRRRSRRCFLMTLALANTSLQQGEIHELLALVYYDGLQNVVPFYDQRSVIPSKDAIWTMFCENSMRHFKKAFAHKENWSHVFYLGKLSEKLGYSPEISLSFYDKAIVLNQSAVDPFYRMHASRLKLLCSCTKQNQEAFKVIAAYSFNQLTKETVLNIFNTMGTEIPHYVVDTEDSCSEPMSIEEDKKKNLEQVWNLLYDDCLSALQICVEGDLKHFHKARYMLAQGLYKRGRNGDLEKAKEELSFCFKSSRSSFTINMWEIDSMVKKGRRKTPSVSGNRKVLEVNLPESSRKFITCIRKYMLFYVTLLDNTGDISTLDRAYISLRTDKRFSLCLEDLVPLTLGRYIKALISCMHQHEIGDGGSQISFPEHLLEKMFSLFMEQMNLWSDICNLPEMNCPELSESNLFGYLYNYIQALEKNVKLETLEGINDKIRKRLKNPKLSNSNSSKIYKHVSVSWCRSLVFSLALITPLHSTSNESQSPNKIFLDNNNSENTHLLCVDLQTDELWTSSFEDQTHLRNLETQWNLMLSKIKNIVVKRVCEDDMETVTSLLKSCYNFYKDTSCAMLPSGINLYTVPSQLSTETYIQPGIDGVDIIDMSTARKLLLWAYTLLHGRCTNISAVVKYCEEMVKLKVKKGSGSASTMLSPTSHSGANKDGAGKSDEPETAIPPLTAIKLSFPETRANMGSSSPHKLERPNLFPRSEAVQHEMLSGATHLRHCNYADTSYVDKSDEI